MLSLQYRLAYEFLHHSILYLHSPMPLSPRSSQHIQDLESDMEVPSARV